MAFCTIFVYDYDPMSLYLCDQREVSDKVLVVVSTRTTLAQAGTPLT
jgi:hypothetical protein